jgi:hypothetical protein
VTVPVEVDDASVTDVAVLPVAALPPVPPVPVVWLDLVLPAVRSRLFASSASPSAREGVVDGPESPAGSAPAGSAPARSGFAASA